MPEDTELRRDIVEVIENNPLPAETIVNELPNEYPPDEIRVELDEMVDEGELEIPSEFEDTYRIPEL